MLLVLAAILYYFVLPKKQHLISISCFDESPKKVWIRPKLPAFWLPNRALRRAPHGEMEQKTSTTKAPLVQNLEEKSVERLDKMYKKMPDFLAMNILANSNAPWFRCCIFLQELRFERFEFPWLPPPQVASKLIHSHLGRSEPVGKGFDKPTKTLEVLSNSKVL